MIVEVSGPVDPGPLASLLGCAVVLDGLRRLRCATTSSPERLATISNHLASVGVGIVSLRTRASLEERYFDLVADQPTGERP
jgi:hypothetical protein